MQMIRLDLPIRGMTCASCVARIEKGLRDIPSVAEVSVNLAGERAAVMYDPEQADAAMAFSSVSVVTNSLRLRRFRP